MYKAQAGKGGSAGSIQWCVQPAAGHPGRATVLHPRVPSKPASLLPKQGWGHGWECAPQDTHCGAPQCPSLGQAEPGGAGSSHTSCTERNRKRILKPWHVVSGVGKGVGLTGDGEGPCTHQ